MPEPGSGASSRRSSGVATFSSRFSGLHFLVDHSVTGSDSSMLGTQLGMDMPLTENFRLVLSAARYGYSLPGVAGADAGDFRSNLVGPDGRYVSDFDLIDVIAAMTFRGWERWPVRLTGEYVHNRGAPTSGDTGYSIELSAGQALERGDWRFGYGYSVAEVDAVLAAFSGANDPADWLNRLRVNFQVGF